MREMTDSLIQCIVKIYAGVATCQYVDIYNRVCQVPSLSFMAAIAMTDL